MAMNVVDAINDMLDKSELNKNKLAKKLGITAQTLGEKLRGKNIRSDTLINITSYLGYKVVLVPDDTTVKQEWYELK